MSDIEDMPAKPCRHGARAGQKPRRLRSAFEFEGRQTSFAEFDIRPTASPTRCRALGIHRRERIAYLGKNSDAYFELLLGAIKANVVMAPVNWRLAGPEIAFIVERLPGAGAVRRPGIHRAGREDPCRSCLTCGPSSPPKAARRLAGLSPPGAMRRTVTTRSHNQPAGHRDPALHLRHHRQDRRARCCRTPICSIRAELGAATKSPTGTNGPRTTSRWWRCRSFTSAAPAGACSASTTAPKA